jgi:hypothetical protein
MQSSPAGICPIRAKPANQLPPLNEKIVKADAEEGASTDMIIDFNPSLATERREKGE